MQVKQSAAESPPGRDTDGFSQAGPFAILV